jgi:hypothetical protein
MLRRESIISAPCPASLHDDISMTLVARHDDDGGTPAVSPASLARRSPADRRLAALELHPELEVVEPLDYGALAFVDKSAISNNVLDVRRSADLTDEVSQTEPCSSHLRLVGPSF